MKKTIHITYYAHLREERGVKQETIDTQVVTAGQLYEKLQEKYNFKLSIDSLKVAINDEFSTWEAKLESGDHLVFIPPVAGG